MTWTLGDLVLAFTLGLCGISAASLGVLLWREVEAWYWRYRLVKAVEKIRKPYARRGTGGDSWSPPVLRIEKREIRQ